MHKFSNGKFGMQKLARPIFGIIIGLMVSTASNAANKNDIVGVWVDQAGDGLIEILAQDGKYIGKIASRTRPTGPLRKDIHNPDPVLRTRTLLGLAIMGGLTYQGHDKWTRGWIYDPDNGKTYHCEISLDNINKLAIRGFIGYSLFGETQTWTRKK